MKCVNQLSYAFCVSAFVALVILMAGVVAHAADVTPSDAQLSAQKTGLSAQSFGVAAHVPVYMQEWHIWWGFPYPDVKEPLGHMTSRLVSDREPWRLQWNRNGYPYVGLYDYHNYDVIRWQIRCMKSAGLDSVAIQMFADYKTGLHFAHDKDDFIPRLLDIAAQEKFPIFFMDEVAFRLADPPRDPDIMADRIIRFLTAYGKHPGFYKVDGKPVYYYQTFSYWVGADKTQKMMQKVEAAVGPVYWMIFGDVADVSKIPLVKGIVATAASHRQNPQTRDWDWNIQSVAEHVAIGQAAGKAVGDLIYPKFDGTSQPDRQAGVMLYGQAGKTLESCMEHSMAEKPQFLMLSSWNDYEEGANFEPAWDFDGFTGDPFLYCRALAHLRGKVFVPPPVPPKESLHPTIWEKVGYGDGAGPIIDSVRRSHERGGSLEVIARDTMNPVKALEVVWNGDTYWQAAQPGQKQDTGSLVLSDGKLGPATSVDSIMGRLQVGCAREATSPLTFKLSTEDAARLPEQPFVGAAWAFDRVHPLDGVNLNFPGRDQIELLEPVGATAQDVGVSLEPSVRVSELNPSAWAGWQTLEAQTVQPIKLSRTGNTFTVNAPSQRLGIVSLLGAPRPERIVQAKPVPRDPTGLSVSYYITLPDEVLNTPGAHFVWVRAQDAVGNWGSPKLVAVPNYEMPWPELASKSNSETLDVPGAVLADPMTTPGLWKGDVSLVEQVEVVHNKVMTLANTVAYRNLDQPLQGSWTLQLDMQNNDFLRGGWAALTDESGRQGYALLWDSSSADNFNGQGGVCLEKIDVPHDLQWESKLQPLNDLVPSGHPATHPPLAHFELVRDAAAGTLQLFVDGKLCCQAKDSQFNRFGRVVLRGNERTTFDNVVVLPTAITSAPAAQK